MADTRIVIQTSQPQTGAYANVELTTADENLLKDTFALIRRITDEVHAASKVDEAQTGAGTPAEDAG